MKLFETIYCTGGISQGRGPDTNVSLVLKAITKVKVYIVCVIMIATQLSPPHKACLESSDLQVCRLVI